MRISLAVILAAFLGILACSKKLQIEGPFRAEVMQVADEFRAMANQSNITFLFHPNGTIDYKVSAMGRNQEDTGQYEIRGDSLHIFALQRGPDSAFKLEKISENEYHLYGPNNFILRREVQ